MEKNLSYDLHGVRLEHAIAFLYQLIDDARLQGYTYNVKIITGQGLIKDKFIELLNQENLSCKEHSGNPGCLIMVIE